MVTVSDHLVPRRKNSNRDPVNLPDWKPVNFHVLNNNDIQYNQISKRHKPNKNNDSQKEEKNTTDERVKKSGVVDGKSRIDKRNEPSPWWVLL